MESVWKGLGDRLSLIRPGEFSGDDSDHDGVARVLTTVGTSARTNGMSGTSTGGGVPLQRPKDKMELAMPAC